MEVYTTEEQQVEAIRKWWRENKWSLIGGVVIGIAVIIGGRAWLENRNAHAEAASAAHQVMMQQAADGSLAEAEATAKQLLSEFSDTPYAGLASLVLAKLKAEAGDLEAAGSHLQWVLDNTKQEPVLHEARTRLAQLLLAQGKGAEVIALLEGVEAGSYEAQYATLLGDAHAAAGRAAPARDAYVRALAAMPADAPSRELVQMKLDNLGLAAAP